MKRSLRHFTLGSRGRARKCVRRHVSPVRDVGLYLFLGHPLLWKFFGTRSPIIITSIYAVTTTTSDARNALSTLSLARFSRATRQKKCVGKKKDARMYSFVSSVSLSLLFSISFLQRSALFIKSSGSFRDRLVRSVLVETSLSVIVCVHQKIGWISFFIFSVFLFGKLYFQKKAPRLRIWRFLFDWAKNNSDRDFCVSYYVFSLKKPTKYLEFEKTRPV